MKTFKQISSQIDSKKELDDILTNGVGFATASASYGENTISPIDSPTPFANSTKSSDKNCCDKNESILMESDSPTIVDHIEKSSDKSKKYVFHDPKHGEHHEPVDVNSIGLTHHYSGSHTEPYLSKSQASDAKILHDNTNVNHPSYSHVVNEYTLDSEHLNHSLLTHHMAKKDFDKESGYAKFAKHVDTVIADHKMPKDVTVYSGLHFNPGDYKDGKVHLPAYTSTSLSPHVAKNFGKATIGYKDDGTKFITKHMMRLTVPKDHPHLFTENQTSLPGEMEVILPRNTKLKFSQNPSHIVKRNNFSIETHHHIWDAEIEK